MILITDLYLYNMVYFLEKSVLPTKISCFYCCAVGTLIKKESEFKKGVTN